MRLEELDHDALVVLVHELLLAGHLIDRAGMPQLVGRFGMEAMSEIAIDEWMGASPLYTRRVQQLLDFTGDDVATSFKGMQLDIGEPPQFMDFRYRVADERHGEFWLDHCGALMDVEPMGEEFVVAMCHTIEDPTFPATACATNPRARMSPVHRPPRIPDDRHPHCHWTVTVDDATEPATEPEPARAMARTRAAQLPVTTVIDAPGARGRTDYRGPLEADAPIAAFTDGTLRALAEEVALQGQLLALSFLAAVEQRSGVDAAVDLGRHQLAGVGGLTSERLRRAFDLSDDLTGVATVLARHPAFRPRAYVDLDVEVDASGDRLVLTVADCPALHETEARSWLSLLPDDTAVLDTIAWGANPAAVSTAIEVPDAALAWEIRIGDNDRPEPDDITLTRLSTGAAFEFDYERAGR